jgi:hypothetical protein
MFVEEAAIAIELLPTDEIGRERDGMEWLLRRKDALTVTV